MGDVEARYLLSNWVKNKNYLISDLKLKKKLKKIDKKIIQIMCIG